MFDFKVLSMCDYMQSKTLFQFVYDRRSSTSMHVRLSIQVNGELMNTGHDITLKVHHHSSEKHIFRFSGGPLSYSYQVHSIKLHFGTFDDIGSEHTVAGRQFPLEVS